MADTWRGLCMCSVCRQVGILEGMVWRSGSGGDPEYQLETGIGIGVDEGMRRTEHGVRGVVGLRISDWTR